MIQRHGGYVILLAWALVVSPSLAEEPVLPAEGGESEPKQPNEQQLGLICTPRSLVAVARQGEEVVRQITIVNLGDLPAHWSIQTAPSWLEFDKKDGKLSPGKGTKLVVRVKRFAAGKAVDRIVIGTADPTDALLVIPVDIEVTPSTNVTPVPTGGGQPSGEPLSGRRPETGGPERRRRFGVHGGLVVPSSGAVSAYDTGFFVGGNWSPQGGEEARVTYELGVDVLSAEARDGSASTVGLTGQLNLVYWLGPAMHDDGVYLMAGVGGLLGFTDEDSAIAGMLSLGGGFVLADGRVDLQLRYAALPGSENVDGVTLLAIGTSF